MDHKARVYEKPNGGQNPWYVGCSCGTAGDFPNQAAATAWINVHFQRLTGVFTTELLVGPPPKGPLPTAGKVAQTYTPQVSVAKAPIKSFPPKAGA